MRNSEGDNEFVNSVIAMSEKRARNNCEKVVRNRLSSGFFPLNSDTSNTTAMKTIAKIFNVCFVVCLAGTVCAQKNNDVEAIKSLIEKETTAFFEIDYETWASSWAHTPYAFWSFADTTDVNSFSGWENINAGFREYFQTAKPSKAKIQRSWHDIKVFGNGAYARFTQQVSDNTVRQPQAEIRVLEKINGAWKIVCVNVIAIEKENQPRL